MKNKIKYSCHVVNILCPKWIKTSQKYTKIDIFWKFCLAQSCNHWKPECKRFQYSELVSQLRIIWKFVERSFITKMTTTSESFDDLSILNKKWGKTHVENLSFIRKLWFSSLCWNFYEFTKYFSNHVSHSKYNELLSECKFLPYS